MLFVDTPKVLQGGAKGDIYSQGWVGLNSILAQQEQPLPAWTEATFRRDMPVLWRAPYQRLLLFHTTGARPSVEQLTLLLAMDGVAAGTDNVYYWEHRGRTDVCYVLDREAQP